VRELAALFHLDEDAQTRLTTATSEVLGAGVAHGGVRLALGLLRSERVTAVQVTVSELAHAAVVGGERGPGLDLETLGRLVDRVETRDAGPSATLRLSLQLPPGGWVPPDADLARALRPSAVAGAASQLDDEDLRELRRQNGELLKALSALRERQEALKLVNRELADTNRAISQLYEELDAQAEDLRAAGERNRMLVSTMAHELRTPLYAIEGIVEAVRSERGDGLDAGLEHDLGTIGEALTLVNDQLDLARMVAGHTAVRRGPVDVVELLGALRGMLRQMPRADGVAFVVEEPEGLPPVSTDAAKLSQILRNLVSNALKFTPAGEVRVTAALRPGSEELVVTVRDTGIGMSEEELARAHQAFTQFVDEGGVTPMRGTGLGLALSQGLAELLGGRLEAESAPGEGSTFSVVIPVHPPA
jgi:signal transduction histidine kinase